MDAQHQKIPKHKPSTLGPPNETGFSLLASATPRRSRPASDRDDGGPAQGVPQGLGNLSCFDDNYFLLWILGGGPGCRQHRCGCACICRHIVHVCNYSCCTYWGTRYYTSSPATYTQDLLKKGSASFSQLREPVQPTLQSSECVLTVPESRWMHWQLQQQQQQQQDSP